MTTDPAVTNHDAMSALIEGRILAEERKHPTLDWKRIASRKIASEIIELRERVARAKDEQFKKIIRTHYGLWLKDETVKFILDAILKELEAGKK